MCINLFIAPTTMTGEETRSLYALRGAKMNLRALWDRLISKESKEDSKTILNKTSGPYYSRRLLTVRVIPPAWLNAEPPSRRTDAKWRMFPAKTCVFPRLSSQQVFCGGPRQHEQPQRSACSFLRSVLLS